MNDEKTTDFETILDKYGVLVYTNKGTSMMPLLRQDKDLMVIKKRTSGFKKNDAVLFKRPNGAYVLHRIIRVCRHGRYRIAGDNVGFSETVPEEWIIGILSEVIKDERHIPVESSEYKAYLKKVPRHRFKLRCRHYLHVIKRKIQALHNLWCL